MTPEQKAAHAKLCSTLPVRTHSHPEEIHPYSPRRTRPTQWVRIPRPVIEKMRRMDKEGVDRHKIAKECQVSHATVYNYLGARRKPKSAATIATYARRK